MVEYTCSFKPSHVLWPPIHVTVVISLLHGLQLILTRKIPNKAKGNEYWCDRTCASNLVYLGALVGIRRVRDLDDVEVHYPVVDCGWHECACVAMDVINRLSDDPRKLVTIVSSPGKYPTKLWCKGSRWVMYCLSMISGSC